MRRLSVILFYILLAGLIARPAASQANRVRIESDDPLVVRTGTWERREDNRASGGSFLVNHYPEDVLTLHFTGTTLTVIYVAGSDYGTFAVEVDGQVLRTIVATQTTRAYSQRVTIDYLDDESHLLRVYAAEGTVAIDAFETVPIQRGQPPSELLSRMNYHQIIVKFREGSGVGVDESGLIAPTTIDISAVQGLIESTPVITGIDRGMTLSEAAINEQRIQAEIMANRPLPDLNLYHVISLDPKATVAQAQALIDQLNALPIVEIAYAAPIPEVAGGIDINPTTPNMLSAQGYLGAAPTGVNATMAWTYPGGNGSGIRVVDIEGGWTINHEDLDLLPTDLLGGINSSDPAWFEHGTAVLGVIGGIDNLYGVTGITPAVDFKTASIFGAFSVSDLISTAVAATKPGDVILIELHAPGPASGEVCVCNCSQFELIAMEYWQDIFDAIEIATASGRIVVEAAGNGSMNLDDPRYGGAFDRNVRDSGAILVGAGTSNTRTPHCWTNYGSRVDLQGWGDSVVTTGYGDRFNGNGDPNQRYTSFFSGTSSASPIVTASVASLQGVGQDLGIVFTSTEIRNLLQQTGTPQDPSIKNIGPLPDLEAALAYLTTCQLDTPTRRVSVGENGLQANSGSALIGMSEDGRYVVFETAASNLVDDDNNNDADIFVHDRETCTTTLVSVSTLGFQGNNDSYDPAISADGQVVAFTSSATNLVSGDTSVQDVFVNDGGTTTKVSVSSAGTGGNDHSYNPAISDDGQIIAFWSQANNLVANDNNGVPDVFVRDRSTNNTTRVSVSSLGTEGNGGSYVDVAISADGRYVVFSSEASTLVLNDTNGVRDVFVHDRNTGNTERVSISSGATAGNAVSWGGNISDDGRYVVFSSEADNLVTGDTNGSEDIFVHDRTTDTTTRVSVASDGSQSNALSNIPSISADGRYVVFRSFATNLGSTSGTTQIYRHDRTTGSTILISMSSVGEYANDETQEPIVSSDGQVVSFVSSAANLSGGDTNGVFDVFSVRIGDIAAPTSLIGTPFSLSQVNLTWIDSPDETEYRVERSFDGLTWVEVAEVGQNITTFSNLNLDCGTTYYYRVRAFNANLLHYSPYSNVVTPKTATCIAAPGAITQIAPNATISDYDGQVLFQWRHVTHTAWYEVAVTNNQGAMVLDEWFSRNACTFPDCAALGKAVFAPGTYKWWMRGYNGMGHSAWVGPLTFTITATKPNAVVVETRSPANTNVISRQVTFTWQQEALSSGYQLYLIGPTGSTPNGYVSGTVGNEITCQAGICSRTVELSRNGVWQWYLVGFNNAGMGLWSPNGANDNYGLRTFNLDADPITAVMGRYPSAAIQVNSGVVEFSWDHQLNADRYELYIGGPNGFVDYRNWEADQVCSGNTCTVLFHLPSNGNYTWYIRGLGVNDGPWSLNPPADNYGAITFTVNAPILPVIVKNAPLSNQTTIEVPFSWQANVHATSYEFYVGGPSAYSYYKTLKVGVDVFCTAGVCALDLVLPYNGNYQWYLRGISAAGGGPWSPNPSQDNYGVVNFTVTAPDPADYANRLSPVADSVLSNAGGNVTFEWETVLNATWFNLVVVTPSGVIVSNKWFDRALICVDGSCQVTLALAHGSYQWTVMTWGPGAGSTVIPYQHGITPTSAFAKIG